MALDSFCFISLTFFLACLFVCFFLFSPVFVMVMADLFLARWFCGSFFILLCSYFYIFLIRYVLYFSASCDTVRFSVPRRLAR